jgi:hypothetical protein
LGYLDRGLALKARLMLLLLVLACAVACRGKPKPPERTEPWLASASASSSAGPRLQRAQYRLGRAKLDFELPGRTGTVRGRVKQARGSLDVDLDDVSHTTGNVVADLNDIELFGADGQPDASYTARALDWLELGPRVKAEKRDVGRTVTFALSALDAGRVVSAPGRDARAPRRELNASFNVRGELSLHGVRAPASTDVGLIFVMGAIPDGAPVELLIRSRRPLVVTLGTHDIRPRDERGVPIAKDLGLLGEKVGTVAKVSFELTFVPAPP